jgi:DNA repair exonuclease SbcCD ATPase subunit
VKLQRATDILESMDQDGVAECPTCGTLTEDIEEHLQELRDQKPVLADELSDLRVKLEAQKLCLEGWDTYREKGESLAGRIETAQRDLDALSDEDSVVEDWAIDEGDLQSVVDDYETQVGNLSKLELDVMPDLVAALHKIDTESVSLADRISSAEKEMRKSKVQDSSVENAKKAIERHESAGKEVATFKERVRGLQESIQEDEGELERMESLVTRKNRIIRFRRRLEHIRKVMHARCLPQRVAQRNLEDMEGTINEGLSRFGDPFWAEASTDLSFLVHFPGAPGRPAGRLSGGQKGIFAVAFRSAVISLFGAEIGMMILDEPTAGMDEENVGFLSDALSRFAAELRGRRQVIMITHADALRPAFDQVVEIGA